MDSTSDALNGNCCSAQSPSARQMATHNGVIASVASSPPSGGAAAAAVAQSGGSRQPEPDSIKMFIGQIPRNWSENEVREFFEQYGTIFQVYILRDKISQQSRGKL